MADFHLICVHPFGKYVKGQMITDDAEVTELSKDREHQFVRVAIPTAVAQVEDEPLLFAGPADEPK